MFAKTAESRSNYSLNASTFVVAGMKDAHMRRGRELTRSPPAEGKEQIRPPFVGSRECAPALDAQERAGGDERTPGQESETLQSKP